MKLIALAVCAFALAGCSIFDTATTTAANAPVQTVAAPPLVVVPAIGAYVDPTGKPGMTAVTTFEASLGQKLAVDNHYSGFAWTGGLGPEQADIAAGRIPMKSWSASTSETGCVLLTDVTAGKYDAQLAAQAADVKALKGTIWLRLFYEMTDSQSEGCANPGKSGAVYIAAWQHVVGVFRAAGATNAKWVWAPGQPAYFKNVELDYYPGASWVDVVGEDIYATTPGEAFSAQVCSVATGLGKPSAITETGAAGTANQLAWLAGVKTGCAGLNYLVYWDAGTAPSYAITDPSVFAALKALGQ